MKHKKQATKGFTLIEILVSLTLLGIIFLLLFSSLFTANKSWIAGEKKISSNDETRLVAQFLRRQISQALPVMWVNGKKSELLFRGEENTLSFISTLPSHRGGGGLNQITINIEQQDDSSHLFIKYKMLDPDSLSFADDNEENKSLLVSNIENIEFGYFGSDEPRISPDWHSEWLDKKNMPKLIRIKLHSSIPGTVWPQIDIPVPVDFVIGQPQFTINSEQESPLT